MPDGACQDQLPVTSDSKLCQPKLRIDYVGAPDEKMVRRIVYLSGEMAGQSVLAIPDTIPWRGDLRDLHDKAWLASPSWPNMLSSQCPTMHLVDLFSGCGAMTLGVWEACRALGLRMAAELAADNDEDALAVYQRNFAPRTLGAGDIAASINGELGGKPTLQEQELIGRIRRCDFLIAGPPCQGHSDLNNHTRRNDPRNSLILRVVRFAELTRPQVIVIENVQGLRHDRSGHFGETLRCLEELGYYTDHGLLSADEIGVPQRRRRCFIVASRVPLPPFGGVRETFACAPRTFAWACGDLRERDGVFNSSAQVFAENRRRIDYLFDHDLYELPDSERPDCHKYKDHGYNSVYGRMRVDEPSPTITTGFGSPGQGRFVHPQERRTITPHEAARLQYIPDFFLFGLDKRKKLQKIIGNAVPPKLIFSIALNALACLGAKDWRAEN